MKLSNKQESTLRAISEGTDQASDERTIKSLARRGLIDSYPDGAELTPLGRRVLKHLSEEDREVFEAAYYLGSIAVRKPLLMAWLLLTKARR